MTQIMLDCFGILDPPVAKQQCADAGYELVAIQRYLIGADISICQYTGDGGVVPTPGTEGWFDALTAEGLGCVLNFELAANAPDAGAGQGQRDGDLIVQCVRALGAPQHAGIYVSNDSEVSNWGAVLAYFATVSRILTGAGYECDMYGQASVFEACRPHCTRLWKAPDGTTDEPPGTVLRQAGQLVIDGSTCDIDYVLTGDIGAYNNHGLLSGPPQPPGGKDVKVGDPSLGEKKSGLVAMMQEGLKWLGYYPANGLCNGNYGPITDSAVRRFQEEHDCVPADGKSHFGPDSWQALANALAR